MHENLSCPVFEPRNQPAFCSRAGSITNPEVEFASIQVAVLSSSVVCAAAAAAGIDGEKQAKMAVEFITEKLEHSWACTMDWLVQTLRY